MEFYLTNNIQFMIERNGRDKAHNQTLREQETVVDEILGNIQEVVFDIDVDCQKYENQLQDVIQRIDQLKKGYDELGEPLEEEIRDPENYIIPTKIHQIESRMNEIEDLKVTEIQAIDLQQRRIRHVEIQLEQLLPLYSYLNINASNAVDDFDKLVLSQNSGDYSALIKTEVVHTFIPRIQVLTDLMVFLFFSIITRMNVFL